MFKTYWRVTMARLAARLNIISVLAWRDNLVFLAPKWIQTVEFLVGMHNVTIGSVKFFWKCLVGTCGHCVPDVLSVATSIIYLICGKKNTIRYCIYCNSHWRPLRGLVRGLRRAARFARLHPPPLAALAPRPAQNSKNENREKIFPKKIWVEKGENIRSTGYHDFKLVIELPNNRQTGCPAWPWKPKLNYWR